MSSPGDRIGRYELVAAIGRGGMGEVWEAVLLGPHGFRKPVALKLLLGTVDPEDRDALVREARWGATLSHPNIAATFELGESDGRWYIAMELVRGPAVSRLSGGAPLPAAAVLEIGVQACAALAHLHRAGQQRALVHGDIKPRNLMVDATGLVKLVDLGLTRLAGEDSAISGTPGFMAPEQLDGVLEPRSDLFALGAVLYALATRSPPLGTGDAAARATIEVEARLADPSFLGPVDQAIPGLGEVLHRCLREIPALRWPDAAALGERLRSLRARYPQDNPLLPFLEPRAAAAPRERGPLPVSGDPFVGRTELLRTLGEAVAKGTPILTLLGPGGVGKTRLALESARTLELPGGAWWCGLADARSTDDLCRAVAAVLGLAVGAADPVERIGAALRARGRTLVILDDAERCAESAWAVVDRWTALAPELTVLIASRVALRLRGEVRVDVPPLDEAEATALFVVRRRAVATAVAPDDLAMVGQIVARLDGLPLAIELAARRTGLLGLAEVRARLEDRFRLLRGPEVDRPERHRSVRASLDLSWSLLPDVGRLALIQLSVFAGTFDLEAADAVLEVRRDGETEPLWALDLLELLVDHSLLRIDPTNGRFSLLTVVQEYAELQVTAGERRDAEQRHGWHYAGYGTPEVLRSGTDPADPHGGRIRRDLDNVVRACRRAVAERNLPVAVRTGLAAGHALRDDGPLAAALELLDAVMGLEPEAADRIAVLSLRSEALLGLGHGDRALRDVDEMSALATAAGDVREQAVALSRRAAVDRTLGRPAEALVHARRALALLDDLGDAKLTASLHGRAGTCLSSLGRPAEAAEEYGRALDVLARVEDPRSLALVNANLGSALMNLGRLDEARERFERAAKIGARTNDVEVMAFCAGNRANLASLVGQLPEALEHHERALQLFRAIGDRRYEAVSIGAIGLTKFWIGQADEGARLVEQAAGLQQELGNRLMHASELRNLASIHTDLGRLDAAEAALDEATPVVEAAGDVRGRALLRMVRGNWSMAAGDHAGAGSAFAAALDEFRGLGDVRRVAMVRYRQGQLAQLRGAAHEALDRLAEAEQSTLVGGSDPRTTARVEALRAQVLAGIGQVWVAQAAIAAAERVLAAYPWLFWERIEVDMARGVVDRAFGVEGRQPRA